MSDLAKRARDWADGGDSNADRLLRECADRIERLEAALRAVAQPLEAYKVAARAGMPEYDYKDFDEFVDTAYKVARAALEGK